MSDPQIDPSAETAGDTTDRERSTEQPLSAVPPAPLPTEEAPVIVAETAAAVSPGAAPRRQAPRPRQLTLTSPYAIIETGGKQYRVSVGDTVAVEKLPLEAGGDVTIDRVLLLGGNGATRVGTPVVAGASVTARVDDHYRGEKIVVFKYKAKKRYRRRTGHRQSLTRLTITGIAG